jgi:membrane fusion protein (multidrug efflux system)
MLQSRWQWMACVAVVVFLIGPAAVRAWQSPAEKSGNKAEGSGGAGESPTQEVVIKREAISIVPPDAYKVSLQLLPAKMLDLTAPHDGVIRSVSALPGQKVAREFDPVRLDDSRANLILRRAKANLQAATVERKLAQSKNDADALAIADARLEAAQADLELAQHDANRTIVRTPFAGQVLRVHVVEGQFVRAGNRLLTLADTSRLQLEIPIDRSTSKVGDQVELKIEGAAINARIDAILPLAERFEPMRDLAASPASALVSIDNSQGKLAAGQTVHTKLIPLDAVAIVPTTGVTNVPDGSRKVQVLRSNVVRNVVVQVLSQVGNERVYVSGPLVTGDELIVSSSPELPDGTVLRGRTVGEQAETNGQATKSSSPSKKAAAKPAGTGF